MNSMEYMGIFNTKLATFKGQPTDEYKDIGVGKNEAGNFGGAYFTGGRNYKKSG